MARIHLVGHYLTYVYWSMLYLYLTCKTLSVPELTLTQQTFQ